MVLFGLTRALERRSRVVPDLSQRISPPPIMAGGTWRPVSHAAGWSGGDVMLCALGDPSFYRWVVVAIIAAVVIVAIASALGIEIAPSA